MPFSTAGELLTRQKQRLVTTSPDATAREALERMKEKEIGFLPVLEHGKLVGVVSERDIARGVILQHRTRVREIMSPGVHSVAPAAKVPECLVLMQHERIRHLPVVKDGAVLGVLSIRDLTGSLIARHERLLRKFHDERLTLLFPYPSSY